MSARLLFTFLMAMAICLVGSNTALSAPSWTQPKDLSVGTGNQLGYPTVAVDDAGNADAVWTAKAGATAQVQSVRRLAGAAWSSPSTLSEIIALPASTSTVPFRVAVNRRGQAVAVWAQPAAGGDVVQMKIRAAGSQWPLAAVPVTPTLASLPDVHVAMSDAGHLVVTWTDGPNVIARTGSVTGGLGPPATLGAGIRPVPAINASGSAVVAWDATAAPPTVAASVRAPGGDWGIVRTLSSVSVFLGYPAVAIDNAGTAVVVVESPNGVVAMTRPAGGDWSAPAPLGSFGIRPQVGVDDSGRATALWTTEATPGHPGNPLAATRPRGGAWSGPVDLGVSGDVAPSVAVNGRGDTVATWGTGDAAPHTVVAAIRRANGTWGAQRELGPGEGARVTIDGEGDAVAAWVGPDGNVVRASAYDTTGPVLRALSVPPRGFAKTALPFSVSPLDTWSPVATTRWSFGDGGTAPGSRATHSYSRPGRYRVGVTSSDALGNTRTASRDITVVPPPPPRATTGSAKNVTRRSAQITAVVNPLGRATTYHFRWGRGAALNQRTRERAAPTDARDHLVTATLRGLAPGTRYSYRIVATHCRSCPGETTTGRVGSFPTLAPRRVAATISYDGDWGARSSTFTSMRLRAVPAGAITQLRCRGAGCALRATLRARRGSVNAMTALQGKRIPTGARLELRVLKRRWIGKSFDLTIRPSTAPRLRIRCVPPGSHKPSRCTT